MNTPTLIDPDDAWIDRSSDMVVDLRDEEGTRLFGFPRGWTDDQIKHAIGFANRAYAEGVKRGKWLKVYEIRACLQIETPTHPPEETT